MPHLYVLARRAKGCSKQTAEVSSQGGLDFGGMLNLESRIGFCSPHDVPLPHGYLVERDNICNTTYLGRYTVLNATQTRFPLHSFGEGS